MTTLFMAHFLIRRISSWFSGTSEADDTSELLEKYEVITKNSVRTLNIEVGTLNIEVRTLNIAVRTLNIAVRTLNIEVKTLNIAVRTLNIAVVLVHGELCYMDSDISSYTLVCYPLQ